MSEETPQEEVQQEQKPTIHLDSLVSGILRCIATSTATQEFKGQLSEQVSIWEAWTLDAQRELNEFKAQGDEGKEAA